METVWATAATTELLSKLSSNCLIGFCSGSRYYVCKEDNASLFSPPSSPPTSQAAQFSRPPSPLYRPPVVWIAVAWLPIVLMAGLCLLNQSPERRTHKLTGWAFPYRHAILPGWLVWSGFAAPPLVATMNRSLLIGRLQGRRKCWLVSSLCLGPSEENTEWTQLRKKQQTHPGPFYFLSPLFCWFFPLISSADATSLKGVLIGREQNLRLYGAIMGLILWSPSQIRTSPGSLWCLPGTWVQVAYR